MKKFLLYLLRWEASTPVLALCTFLLAARLGDIWAAFVANAIGACIFYAVDGKIFSGGNKTCKKNGAKLKDSRGSTKSQI